MQLRAAASLSIAALLQNRLRLSIDSDLDAPDAARLSACLISPQPHENRVCWEPRLCCFSLFCFALTDDLVSGGSVRLRSFG